MPYAQRLPVLTRVLAHPARLAACLLLAGCGASSTLEAGGTGSVGGTGGTPPSAIAGPARIDTMTHASVVMGNSRKLRVYLPPGYDSTTTRRYPVVYFQPGQNGFVNSRSASSSTFAWGIDTTLTNLIHAGSLNPMIVVAVDQFTAGVTDEYTPPASYCYPGGGAPAPLPASTGAQYATMLATEIKPKIDALYRTQTAASATFLMGSSVTAKQSLYTMMTYPNVFGNAALFSLVPCVGGGQLWTNVSSLPSKLALRVYIAVGGLEQAGVISNAQAAHNVFTAKGWSDGSDIAPVNVQVNGGHDEQSWGKLVQVALTFLTH